MRVLVAGDRGYIGSVLVPLFMAAGHEVVGLDAGWYDGCDFGPQPGGYESRTGDIRDDSPEDLAGFDAVVNLAAISNDPVGHLNPDATYSVNAHGAAHLRGGRRDGRRAALPLLVVVQLYGAAGDGAVTEDSDVQPGDPLRREQGDGRAADRTLADDGFSPTYLRNATAYGSPRLRADIVVNNLPGAALTRARYGCRATAAPGAARPRRGHRPGVPGGAGGRPRGRPRPGVQRRSRRGRRADPHVAEAVPSARGPGHLRRRRLARQARLPGRLREDLPSAQPSSSRRGRWLAASTSSRTGCSSKGSPPTTSRVPATSGSSASSSSRRRVAWTTSCGSCAWRPGEPRAADSRPRPRRRPPARHAAADGAPLPGMSEPHRSGGPRDPGGALRSDAPPAGGDSFGHPGLRLDGAR